MKATNSAFPTELTTTDDGVSVRDYIAIQAMTGLLAGISASHSSRPMPSYEAIAEDCYKMADAMIKQSEVRDEQSI